jgi:hypothetical protein
MVAQKEIRRRDEMIKSLDRDMIIAKKNLAKSLSFKRMVRGSGVPLNMDERIDRIDDELDVQIAKELDSIRKDSEYRDILNAEGIPHYFKKGGKIKGGHTYPWQRPNNLRIQHLNRDNVKIMTRQPTQVLTTFIKLAPNSKDLKSSLERFENAKYDRKDKSGRPLPIYTSEDKRLVSQLRQIESRIHSKNLRDMKRPYTIGQLRVGELKPLQKRKLKGPRLSRLERVGQQIDTNSFKKGGKIKQLTNKRIKPKGPGHWERRLDHSKAKIKSVMKKWRQ